jgi:hypothetical protein
LGLGIARFHSEHRPEPSGHFRRCDACVNFNAKSPGVCCEFQNNAQGLRCATDEPKTFAGFSFKRFCPIAALNSDFLNRFFALQFRHRIITCSISAGANNPLRLFHGSPDPNARSWALRNVFISSAPSS